MSAGKVDVLAVGGELQAELLRELADPKGRRTMYPVGCFVSLQRRGLIDADDRVTEAGLAALARVGGAA